MAAGVYRESVSSCLQIHKNAEAVKKSRRKRLNLSFFTASQRRKIARKRESEVDLLGVFVFSLVLEYIYFSSPIPPSFASSYYVYSSFNFFCDLTSLRFDSSAAPSSQLFILHRNEAGKRFLNLTYCLIST